MRKLSVPTAVVVAVAVLVIAAGATAATKYLITNMNQIKPSVRAQLRGARGPQGQPGTPGTPGAAGTNGVIPQIQIVDSPKLTLAPGQTSYDVQQTGFQATCPAGYTVLGTGFSGPFPSTGGFVLDYGTFVGGFFANDSSITVQNVYVEAMCGAVPSGYVGSAVARRVNTAEASYQTQLTQSEALTSRG